MLQDPGLRRDDNVMVLFVTALAITPQRYRIEGQRRDWRFPPTRLKENPEGVAPSRVYYVL